MSHSKNKIACFVCSVIIFFAACTGVGMQSAFYGLYYGLGAINAANEFVGDYRTMGVDFGPDVKKEEIFKVEKYAFIQPWSLKKHVSDDMRIISDSFLEHLIKEIKKVALADTITTENELMAAYPTLKEASDIAAYIEAANAIGLEAVFTNNVILTNEGYRIRSFKFVMWDTTVSGKKRLLATMRGEFKNPKDINEATISIANTFFKSSKTAPTVQSK